jgi:hypothetical protein
MLEKYILSSHEATRAISLRNFTAWREALIRNNHSACGGDFLRYRLGIYADKKQSIRAALIRRVISAAEQRKNIRGPAKHSEKARAQTHTNRGTFPGVGL